MLWAPELTREHFCFAALALQRAFIRSKEPLSKMALGIVLITKFEDWPLWVQVLVGAPHAILAGVLVWVWTPKSNKGWYWAVGLFAYLCLFYLIFVRK